MSSAEGMRPQWAVGTRIDGRFELTGLLSHTGSAVVWSCKDVANGTMCTLVQHPRPRTLDVQNSRKHEAQLASSISAECWVRVLGFGEWDDRTYLIAAEIQGEPVEEMVRSAQACGQSITPSLVVSVALQVLSALELASRAGLVHGDICTGAVFRSSGSVKTLWIDLARQHDTMPSTPLPHMAPEQVRGEALNEGTDLWGLGVLMYRMLFGSHPFLPSSSSTLRDAILRQPLQQHVLNSCHPGLAAVISRALERNPHQRYRNAQEMRQHIMTIDFSGMTPSSNRSQRPGGTFSGSIWSSGPVSPRRSMHATPEGVPTPRALGGDASIPYAVNSQLLRESGRTPEFTSPVATPRREVPLKTEMDTSLSTPRGSQLLSQQVSNRSAGGGPGPTPHQHAQADGSRFGDATPGSVGLVITREAPHRVMEVADMCDGNGVMQGDEGYSNPAVMAGDRLISIDGVDVEMRPIQEVHALLRGPSGTKLQLRLARGRHAFKIVVMRHLPHRGGDFTPRGSQRPMQSVGTPATPQQTPRTYMQDMNQKATPVPQAPQPVWTAEPGRGSVEDRNQFDRTPGQVPTSVPKPRQPLPPSTVDLGSSPAAALRSDKAPGKAPVGTNDAEFVAEKRKDAGLDLGATTASQAEAGHALRVSQLGYEDGVRNFRSLRAAIAACAPGGVVEISSGTYDEELVLHKSVHVRPESKARVTLSGHGGGRPVVACHSDGVSLSGIIINQTGGDKSLRGRDAVRAVEVFKGRLNLNKCSIWSEVGIGVLVADRGAAALRKCVLQGNGKCGVCTTDGGSLTCEGSEIKANRMYGIVCQSASKVVASYNNICNNNAVGVLVHQTGAECTLIGNEISDNGEMGVAVQDGAQVKLEKNRAARNKHAGLYTDGVKAWASAWKTEFVDSGVRGIGVQAGGCVEALECDISGNCQEGVFVSGKNSRGLLQSNTISKNGTKGVGVQSSGFVLIKDNRIKANKEGGIFACDVETLTTVKDNSISHNGMRGIGIQLGATAEIEGNLIEANAAEGIYVSRPGSRALIVKNKILNNGVKGVGVQYGADASVEGNTLTGNRLVGVHVDGQSSRTRLRNNTITGHPASIVVEQGSIMQASNNTVQDVPNSAPSAVATVVSPRASVRKASDASVSSMRSGDDGGGGERTSDTYHVAARDRDVMQALSPRNWELGGGGGRPDRLTALQDVQAQLQEVHVEENQRQWTPRKDAGYQSVLTPRQPAGHSSQIQQVPSTPRGHVSRSLGLPDRRPLPARPPDDGQRAADGDVQQGVMPATPDRTPLTTPRTLQVRAAPTDGFARATHSMTPELPTKALSNGPISPAHGATPSSSMLSGSAGAATPRNVSSITPRGAMAVRGRLAASDMSPVSPGAASTKDAREGTQGEARRSAPPRPSVVPSLQLDRVKDEQTSKMWRAEVEGLEESRNRPAYNGGGFLSNVPRVPEEISTPRGGRRSDEGLLVMKGVNESPVLRAGLVEERASHSPEELRKSAVHGLSPIGEEKEPRAVAAADSSLTERAPLLRVDRQNPAQRVSRPLGVSSGVTIANGSAAPARPAGVPSLKLNGVGPAVPAMSLSAREASGKWQENGDGSSSARTVPDGSMMKDWLMMPTYTDTPRTTRSTLEQIPADNGFFSPRSSAGGTVPDAQEESPTVLPLHDEPDADRAWPLSNWQQQVNGTTEWAASLLTPRR